MKVRIVRKSKYKGVSLVRDRYLNEFWVCRGTINGRNFFSKHTDEREAAKSYDWQLITNGILPVNIYKQA